ncbi:MAG: ATPase [Pseudomonadales bacterium]|nr:ATPase [Pseudomonadales bacterium]MDP7360687.1 ATPase [Pseudomonadales bacterium]MDP7594218.1 ATPase [Pseudomonadales bacterium]HJN52921.1 ATPase [Pseudomonadales bacterium]
MTEVLSPAQYLSRLQGRLEEQGPVAVAVSGGVDSMTLAYVAHRVNPQNQAFHALSAAVPVSATDRVKRYADREGWHLAVIDAGEMQDPTYLSNPVDRCYYCKSCLYDTIHGATELSIASGTNLDDLSDYRPGLKAASEFEVHHPFVEVGMDKNSVRAVAAHLGLDDLSELPAAPCLSSRITTGIAIDDRLLPVVDEVERAVWRIMAGVLPLNAVRCRIREDQIAIELDSDQQVDDGAEYTREIRNKVREVFKGKGLAEEAYAISIEPYRRGSAFLIESVQIDQ